MKQEAPSAQTPATKDTGSERRFAPRISCDLPVRVRVDDHVVRGRLLDLSASGAGLRLGEAVSLGSVVELDFRLPDLDPQEAIQCVALVRRVIDQESGWVGVEFRNLGQGARRRLAQSVRSLQGPAPSDARRTRWAHEIGDAELMPARANPWPTLLWAPRLPALFTEVARAVGSGGCVFVPTGEVSLVEGDRVLLELVPPFSHACFRVLSEVLWVDPPGKSAESGVSLVMGSWSELDGRLLETTLEWIAERAK